MGKTTSEGQEARGGLTGNSGAGPLRRLWSSCQLRLWSSQGLTGGLSVPKFTGCDCWQVSGVWWQLAGDISSLPCGPLLWASSVAVGISQSWNSRREHRR